MTSMSWHKLLSANRLGSRKPHDESSRSPFHKDYDRIVFSGGFRRLNRKTQVHPLAQHDAVHTRLTHSLEVSCVGRSLGMLAAVIRRLVMRASMRFEIGFYCHNKRI